MARGNEFIALNEFTGGLNTDFDEHRIPRNQYEKLINGRIINHEGDNAVVTSYFSNTLKFSLSDGFIPLSSKTYNGISYILSWNPATEETEIGTFPSPNSAINQNANATGFAQQYKPLWNYTGANNDQYSATPTRSNFRVGKDKLQLYFDNKPKVVCRQDYDKSVNIYFVDGVNTDKVINSGFNSETGKQINERCYGANSFPCFVELLNESQYHPRVNAVDIIPGGKLKAGNWKLFFRYTSNDYNPTSFLSETNMMMVSDINIYDYNNTSGNNASHFTNKSLRVVLNQLDPAYNHIEVGFVRYFDETFETGVVNKRFNIDMNNLTCDVLFTGNESFFEVDLSQIITKKSKHKISESITDLDQRLFRANLKLKYGHVGEFAEFAKKCKPNPDVSTKIGAASFNNNQTVEFQGMYKNWDHVYFRTGYFSGEAYPFGMIFVFDDGTESDVYPTQGIDMFDPNTPVQNIANGIFRFPQPHPTYRAVGSFNPAGGHGQIYGVNGSTPQSHIMGVVFDNTDAWTYFNGLAADNILKKNVVGYYYVRGDRKKNLLYQGVNLPIFKTEEEKSKWEQVLTWMTNLWSLQWGGADHSRLGNANYAPYLVRKHASFPGTTYYPEVMFHMSADATAMFGIVGKASADIYDATHEDNDTRITTFNEVKDRKGFFSLDYFFKKSLPNTNYFAYPISLFSPSVLLNGTGYDIKQSYFYEATRSSAVHGILNVGSNKVLDWQTIPNNGFVSMFNEGSPSDISTLFYLDVLKEGFFSANNASVQIKNLALGIGRYIGLTFDSTANGDKGFFSVMNLYVSNPTLIDISKILEVKNTNYYKVSQMFKISDQNANSGILFNGDCFIQRVAQKIMFNPNKYPVAKRDDSIDISMSFGLEGITIDKREFITFGQFVEWVAEHEINVAMRMPDGNQTYWPAAGAGKHIEYANKNVLPESETINLGYSATKSIMVYNGFNNDLPEHITEFDTRIMGSNNHILNGFKDGYRQFSLAVSRDYDYGYGAIVDVQTLLGQLVCIFEQKVGVVPVNERVTTGTSSGELAIGFGDLLPMKQQDLSQNIGAQDKNSIVNSGYYIYGVDWTKRKLWRVTSGQSIEFLSDMKNMSWWINNAIDIITSSQSDASVVINTDPHNGSGISSGFDFKNGEVYWSFLFSAFKETMTFNEKTGNFNESNEFNSPFYMTIGEDFYSVNPASLATQKELWQHDNEASRLSFYGVQKDLTLQFIVNDRADFAKIFNNLIINSNGEELFDLEYETEEQLSNHTPFIKDTVTFPLLKWIQPKYYEGKWMLPINRTTSLKSVQNANNQVGSKIRGNWIRIKLRIRKSTPIFIKSILTEYNISQ